MFPFPAVNKIETISGQSGQCKHDLLVLPIFLYFTTNFYPEGMLNPGQNTFPNGNFPYSGGRSPFGNIDQTGLSPPGLGSQGTTRAGLTIGQTGQMPGASRFGGPRAWI